jgi:hypothetical protein
MQELGSRVRLPISFDPGPLQADLAGVRLDEWIRHYKDRDFEGDWSGVALRGIAGQSNALYSLPNAQPLFADTPLMARCPHLAQALAVFACPIGAARLLKLGPGSRILEHQDDHLSPSDGEVRLHIPIRTSPKVDFYLDGERVVLNEGECWFLNFNLPHRVDNHGESDRVHLVVDCVVNEWLMGLIRSPS